MNYPLLGVFLTILWVFLFALWIYILAKVVVDIFQSHDLGGWGKAGWLVFVILLPLLGVLGYVIARGQVMSEHHLAQQERQQAALQDYAQKTARIPSQADELTRLAQLKDHGDISEAEYQQAKSKVLS